MLTTPQQFIEAIAPSAVAFYHAHKISAALIIAQGCLESGYGNAAPGNNLFGVKADPTWHGPTVTVRTREYVNGQWEVINAAFRAYPTMGDSLTDHGNFLLENSRYHNLIGADYKTACHLIAAVDGYATAPNYAQELLDIIAEYHLEKYDVIHAQTALPVLKLGSTGPEVVKLQKLLHITADGDFGPQTETYVKSFQTKHGLVSDGVVGPATWSALNGGK